MPEPDDDATAALVALFTVHRMLADDMDRQLRAVCGLSAAAVEVLVLLAMAEGGRLRMADIASKACVSRSGVTQIVDRLVAAGHVVRDAAASDRRVVFAGITEQGRQTVGQTHPVFTAQADKHLGSLLSGPQLAALRESLELVLDPRR